jgi:SAM-dependent methyltransferase
MGDLDDRGLSDDARVNRANWNATAAGWPAESALRNWAPGAEPQWGIFGVPEAQLRALPEDLQLDGADVVELGCGTAYWSAWLARRGARPTGVDVSEGQLETARAMQARFGPEFPLVHASAEDVPLPDAAFDLAFSEYGASIWCDPYAWIPEAARLLRPGGFLVFLANSVLSLLVAGDEDVPVGTELVRDQNGLHRIAWPGDDGVEFHLPHGRLMDLLRETGFEDVRLTEVHAPDDGADPDEAVHFATRRWARRWPVEEIWSARRAG